MFNSNFVLKGFGFFFGFEFIRGFFLILKNIEKCGKSKKNCEREYGV
jgi:hypothetical protein